MGVEGHGNGVVRERDKEHTTPQRGYLVSGPRFEPETYGI
jgi:hypothetical protein